MKFGKRKSVAAQLLKVPHCHTLMRPQHLSHPSPAQIISLSQRESAGMPTHISQASHIRGE